MAEFDGLWLDELPAALTDAAGTSPVDEIEVVCVCVALELETGTISVFELTESVWPLTTTALPICTVDPPTIAAESVLTNETVSEPSVTAPPLVCNALEASVAGMLWPRVTELAELPAPKTTIPDDPTLTASPLMVVADPTEIVAVVTLFATITGVY